MRQSVFVATFLGVFALGGPPAGAEPVPGDLGAVNAFRQSAGAGALRKSPELQRAAEAHGREMARHGFFSHKGRNGSTPGKRARKAGYKWCWVAENIAQGQTSLAEVMSDWAGSPGHRRNMAHSEARDFGLARVGDRDFWVMVLARPC